MPGSVVGGLFRGDDFFGPRGGFPVVVFAQEFLAGVQDAFFLGFLLISAFSSNASAGLVTEILGLDIGGTAYDVKFHTNKSFNELWDADGDGVFAEGDSSEFNAAPIFWGNGAGAELAASAIISYFNLTLGTMGTATFSDTSA